MEQESEKYSREGKPVWNPAVSEVGDRSRKCYHEGCGRIQQLGMKSRHSEVPQYCFLRAFGRESQDVVILRIARSAGWGGQKAEPATPKKFCADSKLPPVVNRIAR
jgi:hypothetical protein